IDNQSVKKKKNGSDFSLKIFINSENPRGRRPVTGRIAGKDPRNDNDYHLYKVYHNMCVRHQTTRNNQL
ncbi:hypothetical protein ACSJIU_20680, partial [Escherichia coli]